MYGVRKDFELEDRWFETSVKKNSAAVGLLERHA